jgi:hypothetical protein
MAAAVSEGDSVRFPLALAPYEAKVVVVGALPPGVASPEPSWASGTTIAEIGGDSTGASYEKQFNVAAVPQGKRLFVEIAEVRDYARLKFNGKELAPRAWQPYRWEVTNLVKPGANQIELEVRASVGGRGTGAPSPNASQPLVYGATSAPAVGAGGRAPRSAVQPGIIGPVRLVAR